MRAFFTLGRKTIIFMGAFFSIFSVLGYAETYDAGFPEIFSLSTLDGTNGFTITGITFGDHFGCIVSSAGDVNGDNISDFFIAAPIANNLTGQSYVIFGSKEPWPSVMNANELNGQNGFAINGINPNDTCGYALTGIGDINGDRIGDIILGASRWNNYAGQSYVIFGKKGTWPAVINVANLDGNNGFAISGSGSMDNVGYDVGRAGDVNGDGKSDFLICAPNANNGVGQTYVIFGNETAEWPNPLYLQTLNGNNGFAINGMSHATCSHVFRAGDFNADGIDDFLISSVGANGETGQSYVLFGNKTWSSEINLSDLNGNNGFVINGIHKMDDSGASINGGADVNGDKISDILITAPIVQGKNGIQPQTYVIFGGQEQWPSALSLANLNGTNGFTITGFDLNNGAMFDSVTMVDINGDGIADIGIGSSAANNHEGQTYIVYGKKENWPAEIFVSNLDGNNGFTINGINKEDFTGADISEIGDINADGIPDILIGACTFDQTLGKAYVVFGKRN